MKIVPVTLLLALSTPAFAQNAPVPFVPFTVTQADLGQLDTLFVNNAPRNYQQVVAQWLNGLEQRAQAEEKGKQPSKKIEPQKK